MQYTSELKRLVLPEYGRNVQQMVDHCMTIEDKAERTRCANTIINIMGNLFPHLRDIEDFKHKLWDHLAIMSDFKLDIDYPYEIIKKENLHTVPDSVEDEQILKDLREYTHGVIDLDASTYHLRDVREPAVQQRKSKNNSKKAGK